MRGYRDGVCTGTLAPKFIHLLCEETQGWSPETLLTRLSKLRFVSMGRLLTRDPELRNIIPGRRGCPAPARASGRRWVARERGTQSCSSPRPNLPTAHRPGMASGGSRCTQPPADDDLPSTQQGTCWQPTRQRRPYCEAGLRPPLCPSPRQSVQQSPPKPLVPTNSVCPAQLWVRDRDHPLNGPGPPHITSKVCLRVQPCPCGWVPDL